MIAYDFHGHAVAFSTATELKAALLESFLPNDIATAGGKPRIVYVDGRDMTDDPAWGWAKALLETRSDWWPALGIALQHAVNESPFGRVALDELLEACWGGVALGILEWLIPLAKDASDGLAKRIGGLEVRRDEAEENGIWVQVSGAFQGPSIHVRSEAELEPAMRRSAPFGWTYELYGLIRPLPWQWLDLAAPAYRWVAPAIPNACANIAHSADFSERELLAMLDVFSRQLDLWRHRDLLDEWERARPPWWNVIAEVPGPKGPYKPFGVTLGELVENALVVAKEQAETPPVLDLEPLYSNTRPRPSIVT